MEYIPDQKEFELIYAIVNNGSGSKVLSIAKHNGISGGTVFLGKGTVKNHLLELLALDDIRKEIVLMVSERKTAHNVLEILNRELKFNKPNHGIAFGIPVAGICGARSCNFSNNNEAGGVESIMYQSVFAIVDKGRAEAVIDAAVKAGSKGGTIINARGSGIHETSKLFSMEIEPEKEIVLIISETERTDAIVSSIRENLQIDEPGKGIIFVQNVNRAYGLYK